MSELSIIEGPRFQQMERAVELDMQGVKPTHIARELGIPRKEVLSLLEEYKTVLQKDLESRDIAREHLNKMVRHYDYLINQMYDLIKDLENEPFDVKVAAQRNSAIKAVAEFEAKRLDALQKAGVLEKDDLGDEMAELEENQEKLIDILRHSLCSKCKSTVAVQLQDITKQPEVQAMYDKDGNLIE